MPIDRKRYPDNWEEIAREIKRASDWTCQECGRDCSLSRLISDRSRRARYTLTVHHQDYNPANNDRSNLIALCSGCHLQKHKGQRGNLVEGQLSLW